MTKPESSPERQPTSDFRVSWYIDLPASSHQAAAEEARRFQLDPERVATTFQVRRHGEETVIEVDLLDGTSGPTKGEPVDIFVLTYFDKYYRQDGDQQEVFLDRATALAAFDAAVEHAEEHEGDFDHGYQRIKLHQYTGVRSLKGCVPSNRLAWWHNAQEGVQRPRRTRGAGEGLSGTSASGR